MNSVVKALLSAVVVFAICFAFGYVRDVLIDGGAFTPDWFVCISSAVLVFILMLVGPDAAQRKRNRQNLKDQFTGKR